MIAFLGLPNLVSATIVVAIVAAVFRSRVFGANPAGEISWFDAWLKAIFILMFMVFFAVYVPSYVMQTSTVSDFNRTAQQLVGATVWMVAFSVTLLGLWYAHREKRV